MLSFRAKARSAESRNRRRPRRRAGLSAGRRKKTRRRLRGFRRRTQILPLPSESLLSRARVSIPVRSLRRVEHGLPITPRQSLRHPLRCGLALEPVPEPLEDATVVIDLVLLLAESMVLARIDEHHEVVPAGSPREVVELDALMPIDG